MGENIPTVKQRGETVEMKSDVELKTEKPTWGTAQLFVDREERGDVHYWFHDNFRQVILTVNGTHVDGTAATLHIGRTAYRLAYTGTGGNWKMLDRFMS